MDSRSGTLEFDYSDVALELVGTAPWHASLEDIGTGSLSDQAFLILGLPPTADGKCNFLDVLAANVLESDRAQFLGAIDQLWALPSTPEDTWEIRTRILRPVDGALLHVRMAARIHRNRERKTPRIVGIVQDLSDQSKVERELRDTQEKFELAVLGTGDGLWVYEYRSNKTWFSPRFVELLGFENDDLLPTFDAWRERFHPEDAPRVFKAFNEHIRDDKLFDCEYRVRHSDGHYIWFRARARSLRNRKGHPYITAGNVSDLTPLKQAQEQLIQSEKMASLGGLVAGVAHEMNTPMGVALTTTSQMARERDQLAQQYNSKTMTREDLEQFLNQSGEGMSIVLANLSRAADLVRSFKQVAADQASEAPRTINLGDYIEDVLRNVQPIIRSAHISIELNIEPELIFAVLSGALAQVLTNLVQNAALHAFQDIEAPTIRITAARKGKHIVITFADNGQGMSTEIQQKAFDPFFTTKRESGGTGLGLHIVHNLVAGPLKGSLKLQSQPGKGTEFIITIPV